ncbi:MAG: rhodanese-like domain-containing protein, partial [Candidatus Helarchaeota archaeon]
REYSTLGLERLQNPVLQKSKEEFIQFKVSEEHDRPPYFRKMEDYNLNGAPLLGALPNPPALSPQEFREQIAQGAVILDTRGPAAFGGASIKGSYNLWLNGLPQFAGWLLPYNKPLLVVLENRRHLEMAVRYLIRLGYDNLAGVLCSGLEGCGLEAWYNEALAIEQLGLLGVRQLKLRLDKGDDLVVLDVRRSSEWEQGHIEGALHIPVSHLEARIGEVPQDRGIMVLCSVGRRGSLGASILARAGYQGVHNVLGGMVAWQNAEYAIVS